MITTEMIKTVKNMHNCMLNNLEDELLKYANSTIGETIAEELLNDIVLPQNEDMISYSEMLRYFVDFCSYVENETEYPAVISDEVYDKLVEILVDLGEVQPIGSVMMNEDAEDKKLHAYPELRGSLAKVHFIYDKEIPKKDSRKSLEGYFKNIVRKLKDAGKPVGKINISIDLKYDGASHILECGHNHVHTILTRGDVENNLGKDLTPLFKKFFPPRIGNEIELLPLTNKMNLNLIPGICYNEDFDNEFGIKVETYMKTFCYEMFKEELGIKRCNRRSAVVSICNQLADNVKEDDDMKKYLSMQHFQISSINPIDEYLDEREKSSWINVGQINSRYQYMYVENPTEVDLNDIDSICEECSDTIDGLKNTAEKYSIPIDGIVISILDRDIIELVGRTNNKNMFQVAFKFPAGEEKTIVEKVDFQVGPIAGFITPMARLKPIKINGNTITNVTLSNKEKMERLQMHEGDEVIIKYDIIPTIFKDASCKCSDKPLVLFPTECPVCGGEIKDERCSNRDCPAKTVGHILNFVEKNRIDNIGYKTIVDLVEQNYLCSIGDLYRLYRYKDELCNLNGYGPGSIGAILDSISKTRKLYPHQLFGAIGIPNIGLATMEKVCRKLDLIGNLGFIDDLFPDMVRINGIGDKTALSIINGIYGKMDVIKDICENVEFIPYEEEVSYDRVYCFTNTRDKDFESFLLDNGIGVSEKFNGKVTTVVIPNEPMAQKSDKVKKAESKGIEILTLNEAMNKEGYRKEG